MSYNKLDFSTGALVNPYKELQDTVGAGSIFAKIMTAKDEQASRDKELAEKKAERDAEMLYRRTRDEKQDEQTALQNKRAEKQDIRVEKQDMEKLYTTDIAGSMKRDLTAEGMSTHLTPDQINQLTVQASKIPGSISTEDKAVTDLYNKFVNANKANAAHVIKYGSELDTTDYSPSGSISTGETVQADPMVTSEITDKTIKELGQNYGMSIQSKSPNATISQLANKYTADTGLEADAKIQQVWQDAIDKKTQLDISKATLATNQESVRQQKISNQLEKQSKKDEAGQRIKAKQDELEELKPGTVYEMTKDKNGKLVPKMTKNPYTGELENVVKIGYADENILDSKLKSISKNIETKDKIYGDILRNIPGYLSDKVGKKAEYITNQTINDVRTVIGKEKTDEDKVKKLEELAANIEDRYFGIESFDNSQFKNSYRKSLGLD